MHCESHNMAVKLTLVVVVFQPWGEICQDILGDALLKCKLKDLIVGMVFLPVNRKES